MEQPKKQRPQPTRDERRAKRANIINRQRRDARLKKPVEVRLEITDIAFGGKGVGRNDGCAVFVPWTAVGDTAAARIVKQKRNFAEAEFVAVVKPSPHRAAPPCFHFRNCGGCTYQHIEYSEQLAIKTRQLEQTLRRVGKFDTVPMRPIIASPKQFGYRNRIRVHVENGATGFYGFESDKIVPIDRCELADDELNTALTKLRRSHPRDGSYSIRKKGASGPFFEQVNEDVAKLLLAEVVKITRASTTPKHFLVDAYCGAGFFAKALVKAFQQVVGIESNPAAVEHAQKTAAPHETYRVGLVEDHLAAVLALAPAAQTTLILDPPNTGLTDELTTAITTARPAEIIYISCNPATLARDLANLREHYDIQSVTPLDMFPQTAEIESLVHAIAK